MFATIMFLAQDHCNTNFHHIISQFSFWIWKELNVFVIYFYGHKKQEGILLPLLMKMATVICICA